jgi:hypothetical protein
MIVLPFKTTGLKTTVASSTTRVEDLNTLLLTVDNPAVAQYTFFSAAHGTFSKMDHILGHKASLGKYTME